MEGFGWWVEIGDGEGDGTVVRATTGLRFMHNQVLHLEVGQNHVWDAMAIPVEGGPLSSGGGLVSKFRAA